MGLRVTVQAFGTVTAASELGPHYLVIAAKMSIRLRSIRVTTAMSVDVAILAVALHSSACRDCQLLVGSMVRIKIGVPEGAAATGGIYAVNTRHVLTMERNMLVTFMKTPVGIRIVSLVHATTRVGSEIMKKRWVMILLWKDW